MQSALHWNQRVTMGVVVERRLFTSEQVRNLPGRITQELHALPVAVPKLWKIVDDETNKWGMLAQLAQIKEMRDPAQQMIRRNHLFKVKLVEMVPVDQAAGPTPRLPAS